MTSITNYYRIYAYGIPCFSEINFESNTMHCMTWFDDIVSLHDPSIYGNEYFPLLF